MTDTLPPQLPDGPPLPELRQAELSRDEVLTLTADLRTHARIISAICKAGPRQQTPAESRPLEEAIERLLAGEAAAVQVRYQFENVEWTDTLFGSPTGFRLVRCQHAAPTAFP